VALRHPIRRELDQPLTLSGLEQDDLIVLAAAGYGVAALVPNLRVQVGQANLTFLVQMVAVAALFALWLTWRRDKPRYFLRDLVRRLGEPDVWMVTPDVWARPYIQ
jgi:hypothetical protein